MEVIEIVIGGVLLLMSLFLVIAVLMQSGKDKKLSGSIAGGAETFFGKQKANTWDKILAKSTVVVAILFTLLVITMYLIV